jgi:ComF family protein
MAVPLGELLVDQLCAAALTADAIIPVPLHPSRQRQRGFNQSELLAAPVAAHYHWPVLSRGLVRVRATEQQAHLDAHARRANMRGAFAWQHNAPPPARVLLIDDVLTTGATIVACASALRAAGCREIYALALARSRPGD